MIKRPDNASLLPTAEDAEEIDEEVDEVEVKGEGSEESKLLSALACIGSLEEHLLDLLGIPRSKSNEDEYSDIAQNKGKATTLDKEVDDGGNDESDEGHEENFTHRREVGLGGVAHDSHCRKRTCSDEEHRSNGRRRIGQEDVRQQGTIDDRIEDKHQRGSGQRQLINGGADTENECKLADNETPEEDLVGVDGLEDARAVGNGIGRKAGNGECESHPHIHFTHQDRERLRHGQLLISSESTQINFVIIHL